VRGAKSAHEADSIRHVQKQAVISSTPRHVTPNPGDEDEVEATSARSPFHRGFDTNERPGLRANDLIDNAQGITFNCGQSVAVTSNTSFSGYVNHCPVIDGERVLNAALRSDAVGVWFALDERCEILRST